MVSFLFHHHHLLTHFLIPSHMVVLLQQLTCFPILKLVTFQIDRQHTKVYTRHKGSIYKKSYGNQAVFALGLSLRLLTLLLLGQCSWRPFLAWKRLCKSRQKFIAVLSNSVSLPSTKKMVILCFSSLYQTKAGFQLEESMTNNGLPIYLRM